MSRFAIIVFAAVALSGCGREQEAREPAPAPVLGVDDGPMWVFTDPETKCQYLMGYRGAMSARLSERGVPLCARSQ